jgi:hypothetical protein
MHELKYCLRIFKFIRLFTQNFLSLHKNKKQSRFSVQNFIIKRLENFGKKKKEKKINILYLNIFYQLFHLVSSKNFL